MGYIKVLKKRSNINHFEVRSYHTNSSEEEPDFIPLLSFDNADTQKLDILKEVKKKLVFRWVHKESNKSSVGSSVNLYVRLRNYYNLNHLEKK